MQFTPQPRLNRAKGFPSMRYALLCLLACCWSSLATAATPERDEAVVKGVNYIGVSVSDLSAAVNFYSESADLVEVSDEALAASVVRALGGADGQAVQTRVLKSVNAQLRFMEFASADRDISGVEPVPVNGPGIAHICYQVADETRTYQRFLAAGATHIGERDLVQLNPRNPVVYAYGNDPDGIMFEVEHIDFSAISRPRKNDYRIRHVSLATPAMAPMVAFYSTLMEEPEPRRSGIGGTLGGDQFDQVSGLPGTQLEMAWFQVRNLELEIIQYHSHPTEQPAQPRPLQATGYNMVMFDVGDLAAAEALVREAGGTVVSDTLAMDGGEAFFARDPDGNLLGFQRLPQTSVFTSRNFPDNGT
jgi:catechol 2,3-dioxygenase-like lactoylglutathione lyase family enzyme